jgi:hypothetical protein
LEGNENKAKGTTTKKKFVKLEDNGIKDFLIHQELEYYKAPSIPFLTCCIER